MVAHGMFHWNELNTRDARAAAKFYADTLGWSFQEVTMEDGTPYMLAMDGEMPFAGIFTMAGPDFQGMPDHWMAYIAVDDIDARLAKAVAAGATIMRPPFDVPGTGRFAILREPGGATIGWITPDEQAQTA